MCIRDRVKRPEYFVFENVDGFATHEDGTLLKKTLDWIGKKIGYSTAAWRLNAADYETVQTRNRVFIVGRLGRGHNLSKPKPKPLSGYAVVFTPYLTKQSKTSTIFLTKFYLPYLAMAPEDGKPRQKSICHLHAHCVKPCTKCIELLKIITTLMIISQGLGMNPLNQSIWRMCQIEFAESLPMRHSEFRDSNKI